MKLLLNKRYHRLITAIIVLFWFAVGSRAMAQNLNNPALTQIRTYLQNENIDEKMLLDSLEANGLKVTTMTREQIIQNQKGIQEVVERIKLQQTNQPKKSLDGDVLADSVKSKKGTTHPDSLDRNRAQKAKSELDTPGIKANQNCEVFGHHFFRDNTFQVFQSSKDQSATDLYVLGPGDKINVLIFGRSQADFTFEINANGYIQPQQMPKIFLSGLSLKEAKSMLFKKFEAFYTFEPGQFSVTVQATRNISVHVFGEVVRPGTYKLASFHSAWAALMAAAGPTCIGSVRNIELIRGNVRQNLDVYQILTNPSAFLDFPLQNNDILSIPPYTKKIVVRGAVKRPMEYELKEGEGMKELIQYAGGLLANASTDWAQVKRYGRQMIKVEDAPLAALLQGNGVFPLKDGDTLTVRAQGDDLKGYVKVTGAVYLPGEYAVETAGTVKSLILKANLKPEAQTNLAVVLRQNSDQSTEAITIPLESILQNTGEDFKLRAEDELRIISRTDFAQSFAIEVSGEVRKPFKLELAYGSTFSLRGALQMADGLSPSASKQGMIIRNDPFNIKNTEYMRVLLDPVASQDLKPGDRLVVFNKDSVLPDFTVSIAGDVLNSGNFPYHPDLSIHDLVTLAGGLNWTAIKDKVYIYRVEIPGGKPTIKRSFNLALDSNFKASDPNFRLKPFDVLVFRKTPQFYLQELVSIQGEVNSEGAYSLPRRSFHFSELVKEAGGLTSEGDLRGVVLNRIEPIKGRIFFDGIKAIQNPRQVKFDPILRSGDVVTIPRKLNMVIIEISNTNYSNLLKRDSMIVTYQGRLHAKDYVEQFAAGAKEVDSLRTLYTVIHQNGYEESSLKTWLGYRHPKVYPGDKVQVAYGAKPKYRNQQNKKSIDWDKISAKAITLLTTFALLRAYFN